MIKKILKKILPKYLWQIIKLAKTIPVKIILKKTSKEPGYLNFSQIEKLLGSFPEVAKYDYGEQACLQRGEERALFLSILFPNTSTKKILELGCSDAMTSVTLKRKGFETIALDIVDQRLELAKKSTVTFIQSPAENMPLANNSVDFIFSYNALEHFTDPQKVLIEIHRILRPDGYVYIDFDPLYFSPRGLHAYRKINIPYLQILFKAEDLQKYADTKKLHWDELPYVNAYTITKFRSMFESLNDKFANKKYEEILDISGLNIIKKYPSCFKKENIAFENFIISGVKILLQKKS
jgi:ubiquinone/menaquinone biosynthesis C-methylase UbiE